MARDAELTADERAALVQRIGELSSPMAPVATAHPQRLPHLAGVRAVVFDVYGTLLISGTGDVGVAAPQDKPAALNAALRDAGIAAPSPVAGEAGAQHLIKQIERAHARFKQRGVEHPEVEIRDVWADVLADLADDKLIEGRATPQQIARLAVEFECRVNPIWPMPDARRTLQRLRDSGLALGIVSNAQFYTPLAIEATLGAAPAGLGFPDERCVWSYRLLEAKPSPALYERLAAQLQQSENITPQQTLYVGNDVRNDIWPAQRVGFRTALFAGDQRSLRLRDDEPDCVGVTPDAVIHHLPQLIDMIATSGV